MRVNLLQKASSGVATTKSPIGLHPVIALAIGLCFASALAIGLHPSSAQAIGGEGALQPAESATVEQASPDRQEVATGGLLAGVIATIELSAGATAAAELPTGAIAAADPPAGATAAAELPAGATTAADPPAGATAVAELPTGATAIDAGILPDSDELLDGYARMRLEAALPDGGRTAMGAQGLPGDNLLTDDEKVLLEKLEAEVAKVAAGERLSTEFSFTLEELGLKATWTSEELGVPIDGAINAAIENMPNVSKVVNALCVDCPYEMYWFDKTSGYTYSYGSYAPPRAGDSWTLTLMGPIKISMHVADEYSGDGDFVVKDVYATEIATAIQEAKRIVDANAGKSVWERLAAYHDAICEKASYNNEAAAAGNNVAYGNPWQLIWVFDNNPDTKVVCEGYAKAFEYLCDLSEFHGVNCYIVSGTMSFAPEGAGGDAKTGNHMWNIVSMDDGRNYLVDVTNCDSGTVGYPDKLFMAWGPSGSVANGYTFAIQGSGAVTYKYSAKMPEILADEPLAISRQEYDKTRTHLSDTDITVDSTRCVYDGGEQVPAVTIKNGETVLTAGADYVLTCTDNVNAGEGTYSVTGKNNYIGTISGEFNIAPARIESANVTANPASFTYDGTAKEPAVTVTIGDGKQLKSGEDGDYDVEYIGNANAGEATVKVTGKGNYAGEAVGTFTIAKAPVTAPAAAAGLVYDGSEQTGVPAGEGYTVTGSKAANAGSYTATATLADPANHEWADGTPGANKEVPWSIARASIQGAIVTTSPSSFTYDGTTKKPASISVKLGTTSLDAKDFNVAYGESAEAGTVTVTVTGKGNYAGEAEGTFTIAKARVTAPTAATGLAFNGSEQTGVATGDGYTVVGNKGTAAGGYTATAKLVDPANHEWADGSTNDKSIAWSVAPASLADADISIDPVNFYSDGQPKELAIAIAFHGKGLAVGDDYTVAYENNIEPGTATATITGNGNYKDMVKVDFEIAPAATEEQQAGGAGSQAGAEQPSDSRQSTSATRAEANSNGGSPDPASSQGSASEQEPDAVERKTMHRLYNPWSGEHFYTSDEAEYANVVTAGWTDEGTGWTAPETSNTPVFRMYNKWGGEHHYCMTAEERDTLVDAGWEYEGIGWYSDDAKTVPLYREYNPYEFSNNHNYTTNKIEHDSLVAIGWIDEGYAWYGI